jgi:hypothetical protein
MCLGCLSLNYWPAKSKTSKLINNKTNKQAQPGAETSPSLPGGTPGHRRLHLSGLSTVTWNCQGLNSPNKQNTLKEFLLTYRPDIVFLCETHTGINDGIFPLHPAYTATSELLSVLIPEQLKSAVQ